MIIGMNNFCQISTPLPELESDNEQFDSEPPPPKIKRYQEAVSMLEDVQLFLDSRGHSGVATKVGSLMDTGVLTV